jgi:hypothetical protein
MPKSRVVAIALTGLALLVGLASNTAESCTIQCPDCAATLCPVQTLMVESNATMVVMETSLAELQESNQRIWCQCCSVLTSLPRMTPGPTYTPLQ